MRKIKEVLRLRFQLGLSQGQIARSCSISQGAVSKYLKRAQAAGVSWPLPEGWDEARLEEALFGHRPRRVYETCRPTPDFATLHQELQSHRHLTLQLLWEEYRQDHPDGYGYSRFCELYRRWQRSVDLVMRQEHKAGEKLFVDFPGRRIPIYDESTGEVLFQAELFVAVLGASGYLYAEAVRSQELLHWVSAHVHAFEHLGGCPQIVVCDNLRSGVTRAHRYEPDVNATYQEMATHYGVAVIPARSYKPRDKAKAEGGVLLAERFIMARLRNRRFTSLAEANLEIARLTAWVNERPFKKLEGSRKKLFEALDRPALRPLPATRYEFATWRRARVGLDYHLELRSERHYYSVPHRLVGEEVWLRLSAATVEVFHKHRRVASHVRAYRPGFSTDTEHMPESHRRHREWSPSRIISWARTTGPATAKLVEQVMASRPHPEQGFRSCLGIIRLGERYGKDRLEAACERALAVRALSYRSIESILRSGLDRQPLPKEGPSRQHPDHRNLRGSDYYR